ncbi:serine carboxypeptidase [Russula aff. rugulosa BPL654]|nr:serine carboxypeptidase [Russula aff. rugulosa BPL654]
MFLALSISLVLVGVAIASVNLHVQDSDFLSVKAQIPMLSRVSTGAQAEFQPVGQLSAIKSDQWTILRHPVFPKYSARIKQTDFCDTTVKAYTGYIDFQAKHLFFYFFESRNDPDKDDSTFFKQSWNSNANVFFVDQPIGVGFSYAEHGQSVSTSEEAARDIAAFVAIFFENFPSFKGRAFHMAGESYAGRYIPLFASAVCDQNAELVRKSLTPINLTSVIIGNGITDRLTMIDAYYSMTCTPATVPPVLDISTCIRMKNALPRCKRWFKDACIDQYDEMNCRAAFAFCSAELRDPFTATGLNYYDISRPCGDPESLCYPVTRVISHFLDRPDVRTTLGVDPQVPENFSSCSPTVGMAFSAAQDRLHSSTEYVSALLARRVRVLIYAGTYDWICNWIGNEAWTRALEWHGQKDFAALPLREWKVDGHVVGKTRSAHGLTFATVDGQVPYDKPAEALALINRWLSLKEL